MANYQWYPGHMTKARRMIEEDMRLVDVVIEVLDARIPYASRNPDIDRLSQGKGRVVILNKADLAERSATEAWIRHFAEKHIPTVALDARKSGISSSLSPAIREASAPVREKLRRRGMKERPMRVLIAGIPNVGKSTLINSFAGKAIAKTGNKPGVTKGKQWIRISKEAELLDTPGLLWPRFEDPAVGEHLAMIGAMSDDVVDTETLAVTVLELLAERRADALRERYALTGASEETDRIDPDDAFTAIARARGCLRKGGEADTEKAAAILIDEFRKGVFGPLTIEFPPKEDAAEEPARQAETERQSGQRK